MNPGFDAPSVEDPQVAGHGDGSPERTRERSSRPVVSLLTNFIPPYRIPFLEELGRVTALTVHVDTAMESDRHWPSYQGPLEVVRNTGLSVPSRFLPGRKRDLHIPIDLLSRLRRARPDYVISGEMGARTLQAIAYARLIHRAPVLVHFDGSVYSEANVAAPIRQVRRWIARLADGFIVNGADGRAYLASLGVSASDVLVLPFAVDRRFETPARPPREPGDARHLLYVGDVTRRKNLASFLKVASRLLTQHPDHQLHVHVVGDGPEREAIASIPAPRNLRILMHGAMPYERLPEVYRQAEALVLPSLYDTWGLVVNEALASGLPVLGSTRCQAVSHLIEDGIQGWTFDPTNEPSMAEAILGFLDAKPDELLAMSDAARATASQLNPERLALALRDFLVSTRAR